MKNYLLLWMHPCYHDGDEWVGIVNTEKELNELYQENLHSEKSELFVSWGLELVAFEYIKDKGFVPISLPVKEKKEKNDIHSK